MRRFGPARVQSGLSAYGARAAHPVYRLGPSSQPPTIRDDTTVHVIEGDRHARRIEIGLIQGRVDAGEWHGERDVAPAHRWEHTEGLDRDGVNVPSTTPIFFLLPRGGPKGPKPCRSALLLLFYGKG